MKIFSIEIKITLLILVIVAAIIATGYLSYKNLSQIVQSIHKEARPDYKLIKIKEITADLADVDNSVRLYSLSREPRYLKPYNKIISTIDKKVNELLSLQGADTSQLANIREIERLISERLIVWDQILLLHAKPMEKEVFSEFYSTIEKIADDTINVKNNVDTIVTAAPKKSSILKRLFAKKEREKETVVVKEEITLGKEKVQEEVEKLEKSLSDIETQQVATESQLLKRNNDLGAQLQFLIMKLEQRETESLFLKSVEAEVLARQTYRWLAVFCVAAVVLLVGVLLIIINYSRKSYQSQKVLRQAKIEADNLVKAKELFTANVSHELRTPMNAIYGLSEQLLQQPMESRLKEQVNVIKKSADYLNKIVNDILDFSKIQAGKLYIENITFNPKSVFQEVCALNQVIADQKKLEFYCNFADIPKWVVGDPVRLRQILLNLLNNAFKFTSRGKVSVDVNASVSGDKAVFTIVVSDTGIGIPDEKLESIFDDYSQAEESTSRRFGGTGLGLSIVRRLIDLLHGKIEVKSTQLLGTSFTCTIPFELSKEEVEEVDDNEIIAFPEELKDISVLVADDEEYNRILLSTIFRKWGITYKCVSNGKDAVELLQTATFDIILMDIRMPQMNGYEATAKILNHSPGTKIIALTAGNSADDDKKSMEAGMAGLLMKPFNEKELIGIIQKSLGRSAASHSKPERIYSPSPEAETEEINLEELYRVAAGDDQFVEEMLNLFVKSTKSGVQSLNENLETENWSGITDAAHKMAPQCRHLGLTNLYKRLKEIEKLENGEKNIKLARQLVEMVEKQINSITSKIEHKIA